VRAFTPTDLDVQKHNRRSSLAMLRQIGAAANARKAGIADLLPRDIAQARARYFVTGTIGERN
jgi:hypothetical protein